MFGVRYTEWDFRYALGRLGFYSDGPIRIGYRAATVTGPARMSDGTRVWVRVGTVADHVVWMRPEAIEEASRELSFLVPMPHVLGSFTWSRPDVDEGVDRRARAHVFAYVEGAPVSPEPMIREDPSVDEVWWDDLRRAHDRISEAGWAGPGQSERRVRRWVSSLAGERFADTEIEWIPQHNDFHWQNLLAPKLTVVDWEGFSLAPAGSDAAHLLIYSLAHPPTADRVRDLFSDVLSGESGELAQVFAAANVLTAVENGFHDDLREPIRDHVKSLLAD